LGSVLAKAFQASDGQRAVEPNGRMTSGAGQYRNSRDAGRRLPEV
jgi:hypothetical protein